MGLIDGERQKLQLFPREQVCLRIYGRMFGKCWAMNSYNCTCCVLIQLYILVQDVLGRGSTSGIHMCMYLFN
jgi:hypothetical protein